MSFKLKNYLLIISLLTTSLYATEGISKWLRPAEIPQPKDNKITPDRVRLGKLLFFDERLSSSNKISCATCHHPSNGWSDKHPTPKAIGHNGAMGDFNSPVILNTAYQNRQFWNGRVKTLEQQASGPMEARVEMNISLKDLIPKLNKINAYKLLFKIAYPKSDGVITTEYLSKAIATFERTIVSTEAPFDKYIKGDENAISKDAKDGFELFKSKAKCIDCHDGFNFSDGSFHNIGLNAGELKAYQLGRYNVKKRDAWYGVMKTPTLRDVTKSYPYFHDGSVESLKEATEICSSGGRYKEGVRNKSLSIVDRDLTPSEVDKIVEFMKSLTGADIQLEIPKKFPQ